MILNPFESFPSNHSIENSNLVKRIGYGLKFANIVRSFKKWFENCMFETSINKSRQNLCFDGLFFLE